MRQKHFEVAIVGAGISGTALFYELAAFSDIKKVALLEKYDGVATLNSSGKGNSQTIHCGDIETNYTLEKAKKVSQVANMPVKYALKYNLEGKYMFAHQKMTLAIGDAEVERIKERYESFKELFPYLEIYDKEKLKQIEPNVVFDANGNERPENIIAIGAQNGQYTTMDFGGVANSLVQNALNLNGAAYARIKRRE